MPQYYLADLRSRIDYANCLAWLSRYQLFLPNSRATGAKLRELLGIAAERVYVTGCALPAIFDSLPKKIDTRHILMVGGLDPRKNPDCVVRAHARCNTAQSRRIPLVLLGYTTAELAAFRGLASTEGGEPGLVEVLSGLSDVELLALYRNALCLVAPSTAEGFDVPVIEAMACGVPVLVSDIPAHRELVSETDRRFDANDHDRLAALLAGLIRHPAQRMAAVAQQQAIWPQFRAAEVSLRFWKVIEARLAAQAAPSVARRRRPAIAVMTPLPPDHSGVADYTAAACSELGRLVDLHVFTETERPAPISNCVSIRPLSTLPYLSVNFDRTISVLGNSHFHLSIFHHLLRYGGTAIAHDSRMLGFYRNLIGMEPTVAVASRELGRDVTSAEIDRWCADESTLEATFYGEIAEAADPVIVHSPVTARLMRDRFAIAPVHLPFCIYRPWSAEALAQKTAARRRLRLHEGQVVIVSFGYVHESKGPADAIWALEIMRGWRIDASLHFVGSDVHARALHALVKRLGLEDRVVFKSDYVTEQTYRDYLVGADLGLQLRWTYLGSLSGALLDCIAAGLPTVTNESLGEMMDAPEYVRCVPDQLSPVLVAEALADLLDSGLPRTNFEAARQAYTEAHSFRVYSERLCEALALEIRRAA
jgi:glycosyltransferase involved in cell wall biosynthesis